MASIATASDGRDCPPIPGQGLSDGRREAIGTLDTSVTRYIYYRIYTKDGPITSNNPIYANNPFVSRTLPKLITPPHTALSVKKHFCKIEGLALSGAASSTLFESLSSQTALAEFSRLALREHSGLGLSENDPLVLVVGVKDAEKRSASTAQSEGLPAAIPPEPRYVHYRLYDEGGALVSKTSFGSDDSSLGRIDTLCIAPPQTVSSLRSQVIKVEGFIGQKIQLFEDIDGEVPMNDDDHISLQAQPYPGRVEDEPITVICSSENQGKDGESQKKAQVNRVQLSFSKQIKGVMTVNPNKIAQPDWLPFDKNEIMYTDGIKTAGSVIGNSLPFNGYMAMNSAGRKGFVYEPHVRFC